MSRIGYREKRGFTLVEMLVAVSVFTVVMIIAVGALLIVNDSYRKTRQLRDVMDNVNLMVELITKEIRAGNTYHCNDTIGTLSDPRDCPRASGGSTSFVFNKSDGTSERYRLEGGQLKRLQGFSWIPIHDPDVTIDSLKFYVDGAEDDLNPGSPDPYEQPRVTITVTGSVELPRLQTDFQLQTTATQRVVELN